MVRWRKEKTCFLLSYWCLERACQQRQKMLNSVVFHLSDEKAPGFLRKRGHISGGKWYTYYISGNEKSPALSSFFQRHWGYKSKYCFQNSNRECLWVGVRKLAWTFPLSFSTFHVQGIYITDLPRVHVRKKWEGRCKERLKKGSDSSKEEEWKRIGLGTWDHNSMSWLWTQQKKI